MTLPSAGDCCQGRDALSHPELPGCHLGKVASLEPPPHELSGGVLCGDSIGALVCEGHIVPPLDTLGLVQVTESKVRKCWIEE